MRRWNLIWERGVNHYEEREYRADNIALVLSAWQTTHPKVDIRAVVSIQEQERIRRGPHPEPEEIHEMTPPPPMEERDWR